MAVLGIAVVTDSTTGIVDITARGVLDLSTAAVVHGAVLKAAAEEPSCIVVDLNDTVITDKRAAAVFIALTGRLSESMIGLAVHVTPGDTAELLQRILTGSVPVSDDRSGAIAALTNGGRRYRRLHMHLMPMAAAATQARTLVDLACLNWGLDIDRDSARSVVSELVTNAIQHTGTDVDVSVVCAGAYLIIRVRDRSTVLPAMTTHGSDTDRSEGWGPTLVDATVTGWGFHATDTGKTAWAALRLQPMTAVGRTEQASGRTESSVEASTAPRTDAPFPVAEQRATDAARADRPRIAPDQVWRQARTAAGLEPTVLSPLTVRRSAARGAVYACLLTDPRRDWAVRDVLGAIPPAQRPAGGMVRSTIYVLLDDAVMERVPFHRVLTARLTPEGIRLLRALLGAWGLGEPTLPGPRQD